jgi:hypothetical protein
MLGGLDGDVLEVKLASLVAMPRFGVGKRTWSCKFFSLRGILREEVWL